jgi:hypothetical protein
MAAFYPMQEPEMVDSGGFAASRQRTFTCELLSRPEEG